MRTLPPNRGANQSPSAASLTPPIMVLLVVEIDRKIVMPRKIYKNAKVTIKDGKPVFTTMYPLSQPMEMHTANDVRMAIHIGNSQVTDIIAMTIPAKPIIEPTDRSNSPAIISRQAPTAMIANCAETIVQFNVPSDENMPESRATSRKKTNTRMVPHIEPSSGRIIARVNADCCFTRSSDATVSFAAV